MKEHGYGQVPAILEFGLSIHASLGQTEAAARTLGELLKLFNRTTPSGYLCNYMIRAGKNAGCFNTAKSWFDLAIREGPDPETYRLMLNACVDVKQWYLGEQIIGLIRKSVFATGLRADVQAFYRKAVTDCLERCNFLAYRDLPSSTRSEAVSKLYELLVQLTNAIKGRAEAPDYSAADEAYAKLRGFNGIMPPLYLHKGVWHRFLLRKDLNLAISFLEDMAASRTSRPHGPGTLLACNEATSNEAPLVGPLIKLIDRCTITEHVGLVKRLLNALKGLNMTQIRSVEIVLFLLKHSEAELAREWIEVILEYRQQADDLPTIDLFNVFARVAIRDGSITLREATTTLYEKFIAAGVEPNETSHVRMMELALRLGHPSLTVCRRHFETIRKMVARPSDKAFALIMKVEMMFGNMAHVGRLIDEVKERRLKLKLPMLLLMLRYYVIMRDSESIARINKTINMYEDSDSALIDPSSRSTMISAAALMGDLSGAERWFHKIDVVDNVVVTAMLDAYIKAKEFGKAVALMRKSLDLANVGDVPAAKLLRALAEHGNASEALEFLKDWEQRKPSTPQMLQSLLYGLSRAGDVQIMKVVSDRLAAFPGVELDIEHFNLLVMGYGRGKDIKGTDSVLSEIRRRGLQLTAATYHGIILAHVRCGNTNEVLSWWQRLLTNRALAPDAVATASIVSELCEMKAFSTAEQIITQASSLGLSQYLQAALAPMDLKTSKDAEHTNLPELAFEISLRLAMLNDDRADKIDGLFLVRMHHRNKQGIFTTWVDTVVFNVLMNAFLRKGKYLDVFRVLRKMARAGLVPSMYSWSIILMTLGRAGRGADVIQVWDALMSGSIGSLKSPKLKHELGVRFLPTGHEISREQMFSEMGSAVSVVLDQCGYLDMELDLRRIWKELRAIGYRLNANNVTSYVEALARLGRLSEAYNVAIEELGDRKTMKTLRNFLLKKLQKDGNEVVAEVADVKVATLLVDVQRTLSNKNCR
ncbi:hypothetical protein HK101_009248 [Irineochytrium annulatum]|nr:hypothetical protein HK101_009248 [Irineochytrium annulatum]